MEFSKVEDDSLEEFWAQVVNQVLGLKASDFNQEIPIDVYIKKYRPSRKNYIKQIICCGKSIGKGSLNI
jgi:hypothetical protein